ncbi:MAG: TIR domain-containing protein [Abitibacteriaceae bacterium]|nr:TIR domain-containing protein [Abditibacteriaceae bacterium]MBV9864195.1 TIR domain-containing protein [Abditibacteriaceae bacterium]
MDDIEKHKGSPGFTLRCTIQKDPNDEARIRRIFWSPDGNILAQPSVDGYIRLWDRETGRLIKKLGGSGGSSYHVTWSPDGKIIASQHSGGAINLWDVKTGELSQVIHKESTVALTVAWSPINNKLAAGIRELGVTFPINVLYVWDLDAQAAKHEVGKSIGPSEQVISTSLHTIGDTIWSPDGTLLALSSFDDNAIMIWQQNARQNLSLLIENLKGPTCLSWSKDGQLISFGSKEGTIGLINIKTGESQSLEGHTGEINRIDFSSDGHFLASNSSDGTVRLWRYDFSNWKTICVLPASTPSEFYIGLAFHPSLPVLATIAKQGLSIRIWELDLNFLLDAESLISTVHYTNAKIVLVGDNGVGKSGLSTVLSGMPWAATESTHGRRVSLLWRQEFESTGGQKEIREIILWDLAGQPNYRLIHQLYLSGISVALVLFDSRNSVDPLAGIRYWSQALNQAHLYQGSNASPMKKFLVASRIDLGRLNVRRSQIEALLQELGFDGYFETSAKEGWGINELSEALREAIDWQVLPKVNSTELFQNIRGFLFQEKKQGRLLSTINDLYHLFLTSLSKNKYGENLYDEFKTCIRLMESQSLILQLNFGNLVLLQPEMIDAYASALVDAAREEPNEMGYIPESEAKIGHFNMPQSERIEDKEQEKLLLIATIEYLLDHEIVLREYTEYGPHLIFPSEFTRERSDLPNPEGSTVVFTFKGPTLNIYTTLAVRLSQSAFFKKQEMWRNAATYTAQVGGICGMFLQATEGSGELTLFFDDKASKETRFQFEEYVNAHLRRHTLPESVSIRRLVVCSSCNTPVNHLATVRRKERGFNWIDCNVCGQRIPLLNDVESHKIMHSAVLEMDRAADIQRNHAAAITRLEGKSMTRDFDVFMAHNSQDKIQVETIANELKTRGLNPWLDKEQVAPGRWFQDVIQQVIPDVKSAAIFIGPNGLGKWQVLELRSFISQCVTNNIPVIPVLLPGVHSLPSELLFLQELSYVRFDNGLNDPDALDNLEWGITGKHPKRP